MRPAGYEKKVLYSGALRYFVEIGLGGERLDMFFMSGSQGHTFAMAAQTMVERIRKLGPNPLKEDFMNGGGSIPSPGEMSMNGFEEEAGFRGRRSVE